MDAIKIVSLGQSIGIGELDSLEHHKNTNLLNVLKNYIVIIAPQLKKKHTTECTKSHPENGRN